MGTLRLRVDVLDEATLVTAVGTLDTASSPHLRTALRKCLVDQPRALVVELSEAVATDANALAVLQAVARQASIWPGLPFAVAVRAGPIRDDIHRLGYARSFPVRETTVEALAAIDAGVAQPAVRELLPPISGVARHARAVVTEACVRWRLDHLVGPACVLVTELVVNAVEHAGTTMTLRVSHRPRFLLISVEDGSEEIPRVLRLPADIDPGPGRGLALIEGTASRWGCLPTDKGKVVWAVLRS
jgi:anti-anti-sigma regulatory factor